MWGASSRFVVFIVGGVILNLTLDPGADALTLVVAALGAVQNPQRPPQDPRGSLTIHFDQFNGARNSAPKLRLPCPSVS